MTKITLDDVLYRLERRSSHGRYWKALCPFHDDNEPSLLVSESGAWCLGENKWYSLRQLHVKLGGRIPSEESFPKRISRIIDWHNWELSDLADHAHGLLTKHWDKLGHYLKVRHVTEAVKPCMLGWYNGCYMIPIERNLKIVGMIARTSPSLQETTGLRYLFPPQQKPMLYIPEPAIIQHAQEYIWPIFVPFGVFDAIFIRTLGFPAITPVSIGVNVYTQASWFKEFRTPLIFLPDKKEGRIAEQVARQLGWRGSVAMLDYPNKIKDPAGFGEFDKTSILIRQLRKIMRTKESHFAAKEWKFNSTTNSHQRQRPKRSRRG